MKRNILPYLLILGCLLSLASCEKSQLQPGELISLEAAVRSLPLSTRAATSPDLYTQTLPSASAPLAADIWVSTTSGRYPGDTQGITGVSDNGLVIDSHRKISFQDSGPMVLNGIGGSYLHYPHDDSRVYCVGLYPQDTWSTTDGITATASISGIQDLMFAPQVSGSDSDRLYDHPQNYRHLLTLLKVRVHAQDMATSDTWGRLLGITVRSKDQVLIDLASGNAVFQDTTQQGHDFSIFEGDMTLETHAKECGSVLVSAVEADGGSMAEYTLHVICENHEKDLCINLLDDQGQPFEGDTSGRVFVLTLDFQALSFVEGKAELEPWEEEYKDLILN